MSLRHEWTYYKARLKANFRNERVLSFSFILQTIGMIISNASFFIIWIFFSHAIGTVNGWGGLQTFGMLCVSIFTFGIAHILFGSIWTWVDAVPTGAFDTYLTKPKNLYVRVISSRFHVSAMGDLIQGFFGLLIFLYLINASINQIMTGIVMIIPAVVIQISFMTTCNCIIFWIPQSTSLGMSLNNLVLLPATQPISLLDGGLRVVYLFAIPALIVAGLPIENIMQPDLKMIALAYGVAGGWLLVSYRLFHYALRRYESGNTIGY